MLDTLLKLNHDLGLTVVLSEHRLERVAAYADRLLYLPGPGQPPLMGDPAQVLAQMPLTPPVVDLGKSLGVVAAAPDHPRRPASRAPHRVAPVRRTGRAGPRHDRVAKRGSASAPLLEVRDLGFSYAQAMPQQDEATPCATST